MAAYCRVSTKQEEQLNSYENQVEHYTERINSENGWTLEGIYADKGISGTSVKNRDEFNRMIRRCKQGKIDMIITKSIARFARNTVDCLKYVRLLNDLGVDVYFEEQGIHSNQPGAEFYITIYGSIAQSESENISANIKWGKAQSAKEGKYSSKYALTELLVCGECKSAYRRCTWTASGKKKIVWRCINRIEYAKKYCHNSPSVEESVLQRAVMAAIMETANQNAEVLRTLKTHIGMGLAGEKSENNSIDLQVRIAEIDAEFRKMLDRVSTYTIEAFDEKTATRLMNEKSRLQQQLDNIADAEQRRENAKSRLDDIYTILDGIKNRPMEYDDQIVRQLLECIVVDSKEQITVIFKGGLKSVQPLTE